MEPTIKLEIKQVGHIILIPGISEFRTPANVDITRVNIRSVIVALKNAGIDDYKIISETKGKKEVYTKKDFHMDEDGRNSKNKCKVKERLDRMEQGIELLKLVNKEDERLSKEQIININCKLDRLEELVTKSLETSRVVKDRVEDIDNEITIEEIDSFIPEVELDDMKISSSDNIKIVKKEEDAESSADALVNLIDK
jgi:hypothetical protein